MKPTNLETINRSFEEQAQNFECASMNFSKKEYLAYTVRCVAPRPSDSVLEVAAGNPCLRAYVLPVGEDGHSMDAAQPCIIQRAVLQ